MNHPSFMIEFPKQSMSSKKQIGACGLGEEGEGNALSQDTLYPQGREGWVRKRQKRKDSDDAFYSPICSASGSARDVISTHFYCSELNELIWLLFLY